MGTILFIMAAIGIIVSVLVTLAFYLLDQSFEEMSADDQRRNYPWLRLLRNASVVCVAATLVLTVCAVYTLGGSTT